MVCQHCKIVGHATVDCRKTVNRQEWRQKDPPGEQHQKEGGVQEKDQEFQRVKNPARRLISSPAQVDTMNEFQQLTEETDVVVQCAKVNVIDTGGGAPPDGNG